MNKLLLILKKVPSLQNTPDNMLIAMVAALAVIGVFFIFAIVVFITGYSAKEKEEEKTPPPTHKVIMDLKEALVEEMKGTSRQNSIMIWLTIFFIAISVFGILVSLVGPNAIMDYMKKFNTPAAVSTQTTNISTKEVAPIKVEKVNEVVKTKGVKNERKSNTKHR